MLEEAEQAQFEGSINRTGIAGDKFLGGGREISDSMFRMTEAATVP